MPFIGFENDELEEMGFVELQKNLEQMFEHGISLHDNHHSQVAFASNYFEDKLKKKWQVLKSWIPPKDQ